MRRGESPGYPIADAPEDGGVEQWGYVPTDWAATPQDALAWFLEQWPDAVANLDENGQELVATGARSWHRLSPCLACDGRGTVEWSLERGLPVAGPLNVCESCDGTGEQAEDGDYIAWEACKADDDGAVEFWTLEAVERGVSR